MDWEVYKANGGRFNHLYITKLVENYRSHARILEIPNKLFYDNQLEARGDKRIINSMLKWDKLPNAEIPIVFHGVNGREERRANNPSYFNVFEVAQVVEYVKQLIEEMNVKPGDIGIVTPYRDQMKKVNFVPFIVCVSVKGNILRACIQ
jgi:superfamily I DNA and/or RNA helicase